MVLAESLPKLYPVDEASRDPSFQAFTGRLRSAVESHGRKALRRLVDDEVVVGPEETDKGWRRFVERWRPDDPQTPLWSALADMLHLGFVREQPSLYLSPYVVWRFPRHLNRRTHLVVARESVALREGPSITAPVRARLDFDIVRRIGDSVRSEGLSTFIPVQTGNGEAGFVDQKDVLSPLMPRAQFAFRQKRWVLAALEDESEGR